MKKKQDRFGLGASRWNGQNREHCFPVQVKQRFVVEKNRGCDVFAMGHLYMIEPNELKK